MPTLDRITLYPVKSLDGIDVETARVLPSGALEHDRRWRLVDLDGRVVNAKRTAAFHPIRAEFDLTHKLVSLSRWADPPSAAAATFPLVPGSEGPCEWLSDALGLGVLLQERPDGGFPDDRDAPGPTLVSTASLAEVARWFGFDLAESRRRFRANLEIGGCDAFWEDTLASPARPGPAPRRRSPIFRPTSPPTPTRRYRPRSRASFRSAQPASRPRTSAGGASCPAATAARAQSRPTSATALKPAGAGAYGRTWMPVPGARSTGWA